MTTLTETVATGQAAVALPEGGPALPSRISWGAVLAGGVIAAATAATLNILGAAIGATTVDAVGRATPGAASLGIGAVIWLVVANAIAIAAVLGVRRGTREWVARRALPAAAQRRA